MSDERIIFTACGVCKYKLREVDYCYECDSYSRFENELQGENEQLKNHIIDVKQHHCELHEAITERAEKAEKKIEQLKVALSKCSPFSRRGLCEFCIKGNWEHADDCEYVRLIGGAV